MANPPPCSAVMIRAFSSLVKAICDSRGVGMLILGETSWILPLPVSSKLLRNASVSYRFSAPGPAATSSLRPLATAKSEAVLDGRASAGHGDAKSLSFFSPFRAWKPSCYAFVSTYYSSSDIYQHTSVSMASRSGPEVAARCSPCRLLAATPPKPQLIS